MNFKNIFKKWDYDSNPERTKIRKGFLALGILLCVLFVASEVLAAIPYTFNIHGKLTDNNGYASTGTYSMNFTIYNQSTSGTILYSQLQNVTTDLGGIYTLILTDLEAVNFSQQTFLGITVDTDSEMVPRISLTSVPSALATNATGGGGVSFWEASANPNDIYYGDLTDDYYVGIGDATPDSKLDISGADNHTNLIIDQSDLGILDFDPNIFMQLDEVTQWNICVDDSDVEDSLKIVQSESCDDSEHLEFTDDSVRVETILAYDQNSFGFGDSDPSVAGGNLFLTALLGATISDFDDGVAGQVIIIMCSSANTRINSNLVVHLASNFRCGVGTNNDRDTLTLVGSQILSDIHWYEISRSDNT